jgi:hypothetical protein
MSVPITRPEGPTHSLRIRSQLMTPQPTSRTRPPVPPSSRDSNCRPVGSQTRDCSCSRSSSENCPASK